MSTLLTPRTWVFVFAVVGLVHSGQVQRCAGDEPAKLSGRIALHLQAADGRPATGAEVEIFSFNREWRVWQPAGQTKRADDEGLVRFDALKVDAYLFAVRAADGTMGFKDVTLLEEAPSQEAEFSLAKPQVATIRVRDKDGKPVAGAWVQSLAYSGTNGEA